MSGGGKGEQPSLIEQLADEGDTDRAPLYPGIRRTRRVLTSTLKIRLTGPNIQGTSSPRVTPSMRIAMKDLKLKRLDVVCAGDDTYPLADGMRAVAIGRLLEDIGPL